MKSGGRFANLELPVDDADGEAPVPAQSVAEEADDIHDADYYLQRAREAELAGNMESALRAFSAALGDNPILPDAWEGQAWLLLELDELPEAETWAQKAIERFPQHSGILALHGLAMYRMGHTTLGMEAVDAAIEVRESAFAWLARGEMLLDLKTKAWEGCLMHALSVAEDNGLFMIRVGSVCVRYEAYSLALSVLKEGVSTVPRSARAWYLLGLVQESLGSYEKARASYRQAETLAPDIPAYRGAGDCCHPGLLQRLTRVFRGHR